MKFEGALEDYDFESFFEGKTVDEIDEFLLSCPLVELRVILIDIEGRILYNILRHVGSRVVDRIFEVADTRILRRIIDIGGEEVISRVYRELSRERSLEIYKKLPASGRDIFRVCAANASDDRFLSDTAIFEFGEREHVRKQQQSEAEMIMSQLKKMDDEIESLGQRERGFRDVNEKLHREIEELKEQLLVREKLNSKKIQEKIEGKVSGFVKEAQESLENKEKIFSDKSAQWGWVGHVAMGAAILSACGSLWYGAEQFDKASGTDKIEWLFFGYLLLKGLIVISLFAALARHCYTISNAYMHESLKRSDRMHAINFGKFYLEVYGNEVTQADMKAAFENWNLDSDSAFVKIKSASLEPKVIGQVAQIFDSIAKAATTKNGKTGA
ncbi:hypothetical protein MXB02_10010 [Pseudomonas mosselii]|uniref:hypothetical protein n=1 Tax=Pseudomonas mosselii TaxID=78327 RepID=UPI001FFADC57|nr:hypothetical protein [Pseudomonas mosselii]UPF05925.1 hypothetical protein MXB02_10010 [Pseudomonas mosselii]